MLPAARGFICSNQFAKINHFIWSLLLFIPFHPFTNITSVLISYAKDLWVVEMIVESHSQRRHLHGPVN